MIIAVSNERFPPPVTQLEELAGYYDEHDASLQMGNIERVPCAVEQDKDGFWRASARLRPGVAASGEGKPREAAPDDLRTASGLLLSVAGACP
jgi:hypothetical protein